MTPNANLTACLSIELPAVPALIDPQLAGELLAVYTAIRTLQVEASRAHMFPAKCAEAITAGDYVAVSNVAGELQLVKASAANNTKQAVGFATLTAAIGGYTIVITGGLNFYRSGLTVASQYYLSDSVAGSITTVKPVGVGKIVQPIGFAYDTTTLVTNIASNYTQL